MLPEKTTYPIEYRTIPTEYSFLVESDGTLHIQPVTNIPRTIKFKDEAEAREYISNYKEQL